MGGAFDMINRTINNRKLAKRRTFKYSDRKNFVNQKAVAQIPKPSEVAESRKLYSQNKVRDLMRGTKMANIVFTVLISVVILYLIYFWSSAF